MNKARLAEILAERNGFTKKHMEAIIDSVVEAIEESLARGEEVTLAGFGTFMAKYRSARMGVNPQQPNQRIRIHSVTVPKFKAGKRLKDRLKKTNEGKEETATPSQSSDAAQ